jgi:phenylpropionate dioxygenase-like ring-hydroxylating dioxygenase large terminal subunit
MMIGIHETHAASLANKIVSVELQETLPAQYYHSPDVYELERRAIFSRRWVLMSHMSRYKEVGDFVQYEMAGFNFVVLKNKLGKIVAFHNICRYRIQLRLDVNQC